MGIFDQLITKKKKDLDSHIGNNKSKKFQHHSTPKEKSWTPWVHVGSPHWLLKFSMPTSIYFFTIYYLG
jgi:hypothetical protein